MRPMRGGTSIDSSDSIAAARTDPETGIREEAAFVRAGDVRIFSVVHTPVGRPAAGVVICSPVHVEFEKNYRREVLLARALASRGLAVVRFHYRGSGHSDGAFEDLTFDSMLEDALWATARLREEIDADAIGFVGTRWGGLIAAGAASAHPDAPLVLWEPVLDGERYLWELFRASVVRDITSGSERQSPEALVEELRRKGSVDVLGYTITHAFQESAAHRSLREELGERARPILLVQFTHRGSLRKKFRTEARHLTERGFPVEAHVSPLEEVWFFEGMWRPPAALVDMTSGWLSARLIPAGSA